MKDNIKQTNWNEYYTKRNKNTNLILGITKITRSITENIILNMIKNIPINSITECGGGDSSFYEAFIKMNPAIKYLVIDKSETGCSIFNEKYANENTKAICLNLLDTDITNYKNDLVFSAGLIEHFNVINTAKIIKSHFDLCLESSGGGYVLLTFPTPTLLYKILRKFAEIAGVWKFYDERPLKLKEVLDVSKQYGKVIKYKLNWAIGLTQYVVLIKNNYKGD